MIPVYFNFFSIGYLIAVSFYIVAAVFCFTIKGKSRASFHLGMAFIMSAVASFAYFAAAGIYHPFASVHRYFSILGTMGALTHVIQFFFCFPDDDYKKARKWVLAAMWCIILGLAAYFAYRSAAAGTQFLFMAHLWDFRLDELSRNIGFVILFYAFISIGFGVWRFFITKGKVRWAALMIALSVAVVSVVPAIANIMSREGTITRENYLLFLVSLSVIGFFLVLIIFINNTRDRTSFMTKIIGICLVFFLMILLGVSFYTSILNERSYDIEQRIITRVVSTGQEGPPRSIKFLVTYSPHDDVFEALHADDDSAPDFLSRRQIYRNTAYYEMIRECTASDCRTEIQKVLGIADPHFQGYASDLSGYVDTLPASEKDPAGRIIAHMDQINRLTSYYFRKVLSIPEESFRDGLKKDLSQSAGTFAHFRTVLEKRLDENTDDGITLKNDVLLYLAPLQRAETRHYLTGKDGTSHYIEYMYYDRLRDLVTSAGFSYVDYRKYIHPDSAILILLLIGVILVITVVFRFFFLGTLIHPLDRVLEGMREVQQGNLEINIPIEVEDEIGFISHNFNEMVWTMSAARKKLDDYALHLEEMVEQRTKELKSSNEYLTATMGVMDAMNDELIDANKELKEAQRIAAMDLAMASNVQSSFFPKTPPWSEEWEIEFSFDPMSGISGDMYDFYEQDGRILGLSIFDVSGHGIASGLITMIAKTIVFRNFLERQDQKLHEVMESVNEELIQEIGRVDNYLTGLLLRFSGNRVEMVNAGHTDPLFRSADDGKVKVVDLKEESIKGMFLGIEIMKGKFRTLGFTMKRGDTLMLYSDCLLESKNGESEEFGMKRLVQSFREAGKDDLRRIITRVKGDLRAFTGTDKLSDDLTIVILKRL